MPRAMKSFNCFIFAGCLEQEFENGRLWLIPEFREPRLCRALQC